jgi:sirohydrochlorin cobaltochelatase
MKNNYLKDKIKEVIILKKGILVTSFGTTYAETRKLCIESIENRIKEEYKEDLVLRAFTSGVVISRLKKRDNYFVDNPKEALERMKNEGIKDIYIQPLLLIKGHEYDKIFKYVDEFLEDNKNINIKIGKPLLTSETDYEKSVEALEIKEDKEGQAMIFMGHGSDHNADISYEELEQSFRKKGYENVFIGTVEGEKNLEEIIIKLKEKDIKKVKLMPFMLVAGDHATNDMASDEDDSWKTILRQNHIEVDVEIKGLGQVKAIQDIFIDHLKDILE